MYKYPLSVYSSQQRYRDRETEGGKREKVGRGKVVTDVIRARDRSVGQEGFRQHQVTRATKGFSKRERGRVRETERVKRERRE